MVPVKKNLDESYHRPSVFAFGKKQNGLILDSIGAPSDQANGGFLLNITARGYQERLAKIEKRPLDEISRGNVRDFTVKKPEKFKPFIFRDIMSGVFNYAIDDEVIKVNPVAGITKRLKIKRDRSEDVDLLVGPFFHPDHR